jgi:aspartyl-tRNA(Asn)/glutamyl-tRNA(Gln) amidotransferase subunit A
VLGALLISGPDYMQASRQRRMMIAEMAPLYARYDVLLTAGPGPASRLDAWRTINFWQRSSVTTPFNVTGGPALVQCIGFTGDGLPLSMQVVGRPFADAMVLRVAKAYEDATPWRRRRPGLDADATPLPVPPVPQPEKATISQFRRDEIALICQRRGLTVPEPHLEQLCATAPYVDEMAGHLGRSWDFTDEPASVFQFPG